LQGEEVMLMNSRDAQRPRGRAGFTLIELLVVIFLISFLAALTVMIGPALILSEPSSRGAQLLQGNLFIAKQQALRDRNPYGIRLLADADGQVRSFQFIQQPTDFTGGSVTIQAGNLNQPIFTGVDLTGGLTVPSLYPVQAGDYFQCPLNTGTPTLINTAPVANNPQPGSQSFTTKSPNTATAGATTSYRIMRGPRPVAGEDTIYLPDNVIIDMGGAGNPPTGCPGSILTPNVTAAGTVYYDILFAPAGAVIGPGGTTGRIILWVRDTTQNWQTATQQTLIVVNTRTGLISYYPVDTSNPSNPNQYYSYTQNPAAAGGL
jgi:prepilin-type N-terminal cleavage/methylation domain-containing protein